MTRQLPEKQGLYDPANEKDSCGVGFIAHIKGQPSHQIVLDGAEMLCRMEHRGACGCEVNTGDGSGLLFGMPHEFMTAVASRDLRVRLGDSGSYAVGIVFLPTIPAERQRCIEILSRMVHEQGQKVLGWRPVPVDTDGADIGPSARSTEPVIEQIFIGKADGLDEQSFNRQLYMIRKRATALIANDRRLRQSEFFYIPSLSTSVIVYKGQLTATQVLPYFKDLRDPQFKTHLALAHSRFSTNTFPSWDRAQPMRYLAHNGEINTMRGNRNWMFARQGTMECDLFGEELEKLYPIVEPENSDSGTLDNVLEFLTLSGRSLPEAMMMMVPEAWENHESMPIHKRAFYEAHSCLMEPWDGPASVAFTDGNCIGAVLDRNGLRPSRYYVTHDDRVVMASEVGVLDIEPEKVKSKGRLQPGRMFMVDFKEGRIIDDHELKKSIATKQPYQQWLDEQRIELEDIQDQKAQKRYDPNRLLQRLQAFGYTTEHFDMLLKPMVLAEKDPLGSMGDDTPLACLSDKPRLLSDYFKQLFAQVTNPPIDPIREEIIMSLECYVGPQGNLCEMEPKHCNRLRIPQPVLTSDELAKLKHMEHRGWRTKVLDMTFSKERGAQGLSDALERLCHNAEKAIDEGYTLVLLSDRKVGPDRCPISSLLATGALHHHLIRKESRTQIGIIVESAEARSVHEFCLLIGYGADAVNPYLAMEALQQLKDDAVLKEVPDLNIIPAYIKAANKGILKVMSKMGISTMASYKGAQIFEAIGLKEEVVERCFTGTASRLQGVGFDVLAEEATRRHDLGFPNRDAVRLKVLPNDGQYHWRPGGESHGYNPRSIANVQAAARNNDKEAYWRFAEDANQANTDKRNLRGLLQFRPGTPIPLEEVEPASEIVKRFRTGAMSYGALSKEAHETLALAMNRIGGRSNSGEGGEDYERFKPLPNGDSKRSAIKQVASGRFGVTSYYLSNADQLQIKVAQGAKPGEGGQLPGFKVDEAIAKVRHSTPGVGLISPPPHHDIYSIEDLAQLIFDLKNANPEAAVSVKLVSEVGVGTIAAGVVKAHADHILISGADGGTGASPLTSIKHAGLPWELGIAETHQTLVLNDLRSRVRLEVDGGFKTGRDVAIGCLLGAEEFGFSTIPLVTIGCIMMRKCHLNTCPVGVCTQDPELRAKFTGQPEHVINYLFMVAEECRTIMAEMGFHTIDDMVGRADMLDSERAVDHYKREGLDLTPILTNAVKLREQVGTRCMTSQDHGLEAQMDNLLIELCHDALDEGSPVNFNLRVRNTNRSMGAMLSNQISKRFGPNGLPDNTIHIKLRGSAGQSFGAFLARGITLNLFGDANDYVGKGLSGGRIVVRPPKGSTFAAEENIIIGNVALYGATGGEAFFRGIAAERFCVRNSGAQAVIEGVGDHGCEYMTGGRAVVLGKTGRNFAAGMSGGIAYVLDMSGDFITKCNLGTVQLEKLEQPEFIEELRNLIVKHRELTGSTQAYEILSNWDKYLSKFVMVMPIDYKRYLEERAANQEAEKRRQEMAMQG